MAAGITTQSGSVIPCDFVKGAGKNPMNVLERWRVAGLDGVGVRDTGKGPGTAQFELTRIGDLDAIVIPWILDIQNIAGQLVTVTDDWDIPYPNCVFGADGIGQHAIENALNAGIAGATPVCCKIVITGIIVA